MIKQYTREDIIIRITNMGLCPAMYAYNRADFVSQIRLLLEFAGFENLTEVSGSKVKNLRGYGGFDYTLLRNKDILYDINIEGNFGITSPHDVWAQKVVEVAKKYFDSNI